MKRLIILIALILMSTTDNSTAYCEGWNNGYKEGWCYEIYSCIEPIPPICPIPRVGFESYRDGYNRGFQQALKDRD